VLHIGERVVPIEVVDGRARTVELTPEDATARLRMDPGTFAALVNGRTTSLDGVTIEGDRELGERVATNLSVMI
jgi:hypothetical protein